MSSSMRLRDLAWEDEKSRVGLDSDVPRSRRPQAGASRVVRT